MDQRKNRFGGKPLQAHDADAEYRFSLVNGSYKTEPAPPTPTPLVELLPGILGKLECNNPAGSHKMRVARYIVHSAIAQGRIVPGRTTVIDKTEGNFGLALAVVCRKLGIGLELAVSPGISPVKRRCLEMFGAQLIGVEMIKHGAMPQEVVDWHLLQAKEKARDYFFTDQYHNPATLLAHEEETGPEVAAQIRSQFPEVLRVFFVACAGTGASLMGITKALRQAGYLVEVILVEPHGCRTEVDQFVDHPFEGMAGGTMPPFVNWKWVRRSEPVDFSTPFEVQRLVASKSGFYIGNSSAACVAIGIKYLVECSRRTKVLTLAYDSGLWYPERPPPKALTPSYPFRPSTRGPSSQGM